MTIFVSIDCAHLLEDVRDVIYHSRGKSVSEDEFCTAFNSLFRTNILPFKGVPHKVGINIDFVKEVFEKTKEYKSDLVQSTLLTLVYFPLRGV